MINQNIEKIKKTIEATARDCGRDPAEIRLVAVSKRFPVEVMIEAQSAGHYLFGENYLQEAAEKKAIVGDSLQLHFIGHLQSNKAKIAAEIFSMIETVDRYKIGAALNKHLEALGRKLDILVQVNVGLESVKSGVQPNKTEDLLMQLKDLENLRLKGLMTMPPFTEDPEEARPYFRKLRLLGEEMQGKGLLAPDENFELSMGMSNDYHIAIEEGATLIRIGTAIFGNRPAK